MHCKKEKAQYVTCLTENAKRTQNDVEVIVPRERLEHLGADVAVLGVAEDVNRQEGASMGTKP